MSFCTTKLSCFKGLCNNAGTSVPFSSKDFNYCHPMPSELLLLIRAHLPMLTCSSIDRGLQKGDRLVPLAIYNPYSLQIGDEDWFATNLTGIHQSVQSPVTCARRSHVSTLS